MISDERIALLIMYADTLATANRIGCALSGTQYVPLIADPAEVADALREIQAHRAAREEKPAIN